MSSYDTAEKDLKITDVQDVGELRREKLDSILMTLAAMEENFSMSFRGTKAAVEDVYSEIDKRITKSEEFVEASANSRTLKIPLLTKYMDMLEGDQFIHTPRSPPRRQTLFYFTMYETCAN